MTTAKPLRVGLIGAGGIAAVHLPAYRENPDKVELAAICDLNRENADRMAKELGIEGVYYDPAEMLREAGIDAVDICTVHDQHAQLAIAAARSGRHVLVEKPMACTLDECREMVSVAEEAGVILMVAQSSRYKATNQAARRIIEDGEIGVPRSIHLNSIQCWPGFFPPSHWLFDGARAGGGVVISCAVHLLDLMRDLIGEVESISADWRLSYGDYLNGAEDVATALLRFENGAVATLFASTSAFAAPVAEEFTILGNSGTIHGVVSPDYSKTTVGVASAKRSGANAGSRRDSASEFAPPELSLLEIDEPIADSFTNEILHFAECCGTGAEPRTSGLDNLGTMRVVFGIYEAARTGTTVDPRTL